MDIIFSRHAKRQMKWRKIAETEVRAAINDPDTLSDTIKGRKNAFKVIAGRNIKVTYKPEDDGFIIVTAMVKGE